MMRSTDANGNVTRWNYYPDGLLRQKTYDNGDSDLYVYDAAQFDVRRRIRRHPHIPVVIRLIQD